jgi:hypothetical protein
MDIKNIKLNPYQDIFFFAEEKYAAIVAGIGTGKTLAGILRGYAHNQQYPNSLGLILRKEYADLKDSTIKDFESLYNVKINVQAKTYYHGNGSQILFRHGNLNDINILKNINLSWFVIEQAEEYETAEIFNFLRDRPRRAGGPRWGGLIANANGHNWIYQQFIQGCRAQEIDAKTGQHVYFGDGTVCATANTYANSHNLPADFIEDLERRAKTDPEHHKQYVLNDFNIISAANTVFTPEEITGLRRPADGVINGFKLGRVMGVDLARFGRNNSVCHIADLFYDGGIAEVATESWQGQDAIFTQGKIYDLITRHDINITAIDADGLGGPILDNVRGLVNNRGSDTARPYTIDEYHNTRTNAGPYANRTTAAYFALKDLAARGKLHLHNGNVINELAERKYLYAGMQKILESKKEWHKGDGASPDYADACALAGVAAALLPKDIQAASGLRYGAQTYDLSNNFQY